jgi:phage-related protein (TIGR01555 family)
MEKKNGFSISPKLVADMVENQNNKKTYTWKIKQPIISEGVVPSNYQSELSGRYSMDSCAPINQQFAYSSRLVGTGFPGFPYLVSLTTRPEYRAMASSLSTEVTREWIEFCYTGSDPSSKEKIKKIEDEFKRLNVREAIGLAVQHDCFFGRAQLFIEIDGSDRETPLILNPRAVRENSLRRVTPVEASWTTAASYNSIDPSAPDFYKPDMWFMLGQRVHSSRLLTIVTRPLPDMLKPVFDFSGMSLSQLAEPYVDNWLRTRQGVADMIDMYSTTALATDMSQFLQGSDDAHEITKRADVFTAMRSNKGLMLLDKEREELIQINTPLSGLHELQAQAQEHMCSVSRIPAIILTGISPSGLNASSDGEIRVFYDWVAAQQEAYWRKPIEIILKLVQLSLFGEIDARIDFLFKPLRQLTSKEEVEIEEMKSRIDSAYIDRGVLSPGDAREKLGSSPHSGYEGIGLLEEIDE